MKESSFKKIITEGYTFATEWYKREEAGRKEAGSYT